jgi:hypothetical protein
MCGPRCCSDSIQRWYIYGVPLSGLVGLEQGVGDVVGFKMVSAAQVLTAVLSDYELASKAHVTQLAEILVAVQRNQVRWMA